MTESSENTMSSARIWTRIRPKAPRAGGGRSLLVRDLELVVDLVRGLGDEKQTAAEQDQIATRERLADQGEQRRR